MGKNCIYNAVIRINSNRTILFFLNVLCYHLRHIAGMIDYNTIINNDLLTSSYSNKKRRNISGCITKYIMLPICAGMNEHEMIILTEDYIFISIGNSESILKIFLETRYHQINISSGWIIICHFVGKGICQEIIWCGYWEYVAFQIERTKAGSQVVIIQSLQLSCKKLVIVRRSSQVDRVVFRILKEFSVSGTLRIVIFLEFYKKYKQFVRIPCEII